RSVTVCRTCRPEVRGYGVGPRWVETEAVWDVWLEALRAKVGLPCVLGARDTLRTEMGYPLHGNDLGPEITPVMARAGWAVGWKKDEFWGKAALEEQRAARTSRVSNGLLVTGRGIPRPGCVVRDASGAEVGVV